VTIPDYISPIVAYRVWQWDAAGLKSLNNEPWIPEHCLAAACRYRVWRAANGEAALLDGHEPPHHDCSCGVYAAKNFAHLRKIGYADYGVHGEVYLWGRVVEHHFGYRAQYAYPKSVVLPPDTVPFRMSTVESRLKTLAAYGADIFLLGKAGNVPLWSKESGYNPAGLDWLVEQRKKWYELREQERRLKVGDRVAVLGRGIGMVAHTDDNYVRVRLWNKLTMWMRRKNVAWNQQNWRWEADATGTFARKMSCRVPSVDPRSA
jgi:preprotein translocase subunit YajC